MSQTCLDAPTVVLFASLVLPDNSFDDPVGFCGLGTEHLAQATEQGVLEEFLKLRAGKNRTTGQRDVFGLVQT